MNNNKGKKRTTKDTIETIIATLIVLAFIVACFGSCVDTGSSSSSGHSKKCGSCGRTFTDSANCRSISRTGMCKNCYRNFKWAQSALGNDTAAEYNEDDMPPMMLVCDTEDGEYLDCILETSFISLQCPA